MSESVELTEAEREELFRTGNHRPDQCDCMASGYEPHTQICDALSDTFDAVARIKAAARREALLEASGLGLANGYLTIAGADFLESLADQEEKA